MKLKAITLLILAFVVSFGAFLPVSDTSFVESSSFQTIEDLFVLNYMPLGSPNNSSSLGEPPIPGYNETSEYLIGSVGVGIVFLESNGTIDQETENWTTTEEDQVVSEITAGLSWWANQNPNASVNFTYNINFRVPTSYEPINRPSKDQGLWISEAMTFLGYPGEDYYMQVMDYINALRNNLNTNWAFAMFIVDSSNDTDGRFTDNLIAYAYLGGPFTVMTYDNGGYGIANMDYVSAHEMGHIFYATDEYDGVTEYSGYLNVSDADGSGGLMHHLSSPWFLSGGTWEQVGWRDTDGDGIQDIVDTFPMTTLDAYSLGSTTEIVLIYTGWVTEVPYPNMNPYGTGRNVTINTITNVEFRVDEGPWISANATDGAFDEVVENFTFATPPLSLGTHIIETRGINSVGNVETSYSRDEITISFPKANFTYSPEAPIVDVTVIFDASASTPNGGYIVTYKWDFGDGTPIITKTDPIITHNYKATGTYNVTLMVTDSEGLSDITWKLIVVPAQFTLLTLYTLNLYVDTYIQGSILKVRFYSYSNAYEGEVTVWTGTTPTHVVLSVNVSHPLNWPIKNATLVVTDDLGNIIQAVTSFLVDRSRMFGRLTQIDTIWQYTSLEERITLFQEVIDIDMTWPYALP